MDGVVILSMAWRVTVTATVSIHQETGMHSPTWNAASK